MIIISAVKWSERRRRRAARCRNQPPQLLEESRGEKTNSRSLFLCAFLQLREGTTLGPTPSELGWASEPSPLYLLYCPVCSKSPTPLGGRAAVTVGYVVSACEEVLPSC